MGKVLIHPLFIVLVSAGLSGLLLPWLGRRWQDERHELELKTELVGEISEAVSDVLIAVQMAFYARGYRVRAGLVAPDEREEALHDAAWEAYRTFMVRASSLEAVLHAYAVPGFARSWTEYCGQVERFIASHFQTDEERDKVLAELDSELGMERQAIVEAEPAFAPYLDDTWTRVRGAVLARRNALCATLVRQRLRTAPSTWLGRERARNG